jgi:hypothetical protein
VWGAGAGDRVVGHRGTQFTCFTRTKVQILTQTTRQDAGEKTIEDKIEELGVRGMDGMVAAVDSMASLVKGVGGARYSVYFCFTGTKVHILTQVWGASVSRCRARCRVLVA